MVKDLAIIILDHVQPPVLPHVQVRLIDNMSQTLVIRVDSTTDPIKIMSPNLEGENHRSQIKIMCRVPRLRRIQLTQSISYHSSSLREDCSQASDVRITEN